MKHLLTFSSPYARGGAIGKGRYMHILSLATTSNPSDDIHLLCESTVLNFARYMSNTRTTKSLMHLVYATIDLALT